MTSLALALALAAPASATLPDGAGPFARPAAPVVVGTGYDVPSEILGDVRRINVALPAGYDDPDQAPTRYPVLYLLDGGDDWQDFAHVAAMVRQGGLWGANAPLIVVGITSRDRRAEFTRPTSDPAERNEFPTGGGAERFRRFLVEELRPLVDAAYRTNGVRGLMGESLAGLFAVDTALRHPADFDRTVAVSPSLWWDGGRLSREAPSLLARDGRARALWLSTANEGGETQVGMERLLDALKTSGATGLDWTYHPMPGTTHATTYHPAATQAVRDLFPAEPTP